MKKFLVFLICGLVSTVTFAQENISKSGWYVQGLVGANSCGTDHLGMFKSVGFSGSLEGGYVFNPYIGAGLQVQYNRMAMKAEENSDKKWFNSIEPSLNVYWDLSNTFLGYIPNRMNHVRLYGGVAVAFTNDLPGGYTDNNKSNNKGVLGFRAGLQYERNLGKQWAFVADAGINCFDKKYVALKDAKHIDSHVNLMVGVRKYFGLGSVRKHRSDYTETIINYIEKRDTVRLKEIVEKAGPKDVYSIFFDCDKIDIRTSEASKIESVASFMKANPEKVVFIFGYADRNTGTTARNNWLAKNRARVICEQLVKTYGIDPSRIISHDQGDNVQPFTEEEYEKNRSTICVITDMVR